jgi:release factor glutamine methyltransferase
MSDSKVFTVREVVARAAEFFKRKEISSARLDAELLVGAALGMDRLQVYLNMDRPLSEAERDKARELVMRRSAREPVAYILGKREFRSREFQVSPAVLIPRPETEMLVDIACKQLAARFPSCAGNYRLLEFGIGSGAIAVSLALELPGTLVTATEVSSDAAAVALQNAHRHGVADRVHVKVQGDFTGIAGPFHAIVSNPPYIATADAAALAPEIAQHEPKQALFAGEDGGDAIRFLVANAQPLLHRGGFLLMEIGQGQVPLATQAAEASGLAFDSALRDYAGVERFVLLSMRSDAP